MQIFQKYIAHAAVEIPVEHRIDSLCQFGAAAFVDTARVNPGILISITLCDFAAVLDFAPSLFSSTRAVVDVLECHLLFAPCMRQYGIRWYVVESLFKLKSIRIEKTHGDTSDEDGNERKNQAASVGGVAIQDIGAQQPNAGLISESAACFGVSDQGPI